MDDLMQLTVFTTVGGKPLWIWASFLGLVATLLAFDLGLLHRKSREIGITESVMLSFVYIAMALAYGAWIWTTLGAQSGSEYFTGYLVEKTLSMDNVFVISLIFSFFAIPKVYQHRVLFWGILGVIVLRALMIGVGAALVAQFHWVLYVFAGFLVVTGAKMLVATDKPPDLGNNPVLKFLRRRLNITDGLHQERFFVRQPHPATGQTTTYVTPLFVALILIECVDLVFAVDSIPAIFAITTDPFIVYTSNIFAILGLRALYFALATMVDRFTYLKQALALVLIFIGSKVFVADVFGWAKFPASVSLSVTLGIIAGGVIVSLYKTRPASRAAT
jgi:tellurite resistance protein TerC